MTLRGLRLLLIGTGALALAPVVSAALADAARAQDGKGATPELSAVPRALASNGAIVVMPEIDGLSCAGMAEALEAIDQSRYRGPQPVPQGHPDSEIFAYEHRLAAAYYRRCIMAGHGLEDPAPAFSRGFEP